MLCVLSLPHSINRSIQAKNAVFYYIVCRMMGFVRNCLFCVSLFWFSVLPGNYRQTFRCTSGCCTQYHFNLMEFNAFGTVRKSLLSPYVRVRSFSCILVRFYTFQSKIVLAMRLIQTAAWCVFPLRFPCAISAFSETKRKRFAKNLLKICTESAKPLLTKTKRKAVHAMNSLYWLRRIPQTQTGPSEQ